MEKTKTTNVIFWVGVNNPIHDEKYGSFKWFEYSKNTWKYWCDKNNVLFFEYNTPSEPDLIAHRVTWQRWFDVFKQLDEAGINYDKIFMVDATAMIKWNAPNIFNLCTDDRMVGWRDADNLKWVYESAYGFQEYFDYKLDLIKYINCGSVIINRTHKPFLELVKKFYYDNYTDLMSLQDSVKKGTDQTPINFLLQTNKIKLNLDIPIVYNLRHLPAKELFSYNWQLNEDPTPFFIKYGYVWRFNGFPKNERSKVMEQVWEYIKNKYM